MGVTSSRGSIGAGFGLPLYKGAGGQAQLMAILEGIGHTCEYKICPCFYGVPNKFDRFLNRCSLKYGESMLYVSSTLVQIICTIFTRHKSVMRSFHMAICTGTYNT